MTALRVLIGTPAYGGMVHLDYLNSLLDFQKNGLDFDLASIGNESLITRARNSILSYYYHKREHYSHLLFLDADVQLSARGLKTLIDFNKDVIGAPVPLKSYWSDGSPKYNFTGFDQKVSDHLFTTRKIGTAVMLLSRQAAVALVEQARSAGREYKNWSGYDASSQLNDMTMYDVFQVGVVDGEYLSEDYWICAELIKLGYDIHISDAVAVTHHGMHGFKTQQKSAKPNR